MANVDIRVGKKNAAFFSANPTLVLKDGQFIYNETTRELFIGDGVTQLSALTPINGASYTLTASEIGSVINGTTDATPNDTDLVISVESSVAKKNTWTQIKSFLKTYFDTIYTTTSAVASQISSAISGKEDTSNKSTNVNTDQASNTKYPSVKAVYDWATGLFTTTSAVASQITSALSGYVNTSGLTTNYIPKASDSDTLSNSIISEVSGKIDVRGQTISGNGSGNLTNNDSPFYASRPNTGVPNYYSGWQYAFEVGGGIWGIGMKYSTNEYQFLTNGASGAKFVFGSGNPTSPASRFTMDLNGGFFGANVVPDANIHAKGIDSTSGNFAAKFDNSSNQQILHLRNDRAALFYGVVNLANLTASQIVETDSNKNLISAAKGTAYNKNFGTTSGTVREGDKGVTVIYRDFATGAALTGTTSITLINSALIPANTVAVNDEVQIYAKAQRDTATGNSTAYLYYNTSASLSGATLIGTSSTSASGFIPIQRHLFVKAPNDTETILVSTTQTTDLGQNAANAMSNLNINWTNNVYIIQAHANAAVGNSTTSRGIIIKRSRL